MRSLFHVVLVVPALALLTLGCSPSDVPSAPGKAAGTIPEQSATDKEIAIDNFTFNPAEITVPVGTRVTWVNRDDVPHTASSTVKPRAFDSGTLDTDQKYSFVFKTAGDYQYFCAVHPKMTGRIIVKNP